MSRSHLVSQFVEHGEVPLPGGLVDEPQQVEGVDDEALAALHLGPGLRVLEAGAARQVAGQRHHVAGLQPRGHGAAGPGGGDIDITAVRTL